MTDRDRSLHRHGDPDPKKWDEAQAVTGRPNDNPIREPEDAPLGGNSTFGSRAKGRSGKKAVKADSAEDKAVKPAAARKKG